MIILNLPIIQRNQSFNTVKRRPETDFHHAVEIKVLDAKYGFSFIEINTRNWHIVFGDYLIYDISARLPEFFIPYRNELKAWNKAFGLSSDCFAFTSEYSSQTFKYPLEKDAWSNLHVKWVPCHIRTSNLGLAVSVGWIIFVMMRLFICKNKQFSNTKGCKAVTTTLQPWKLHNLYSFSPTSRPLSSKITEP